jgi:hypothetical protein
MPPAGATAHSPHYAGAVLVYNIRKRGIHMDTSRERFIKVFAKDDAKWGKCFIDLNTIGYTTNFKLSAYNPPKDTEGKAAYDRAWNKAKEEQ